MFADVVVISAVRILQTVSQRHTRGEQARIDGPVRSPGGHEPEVAIGLPPSMPFVPPGLMLACRAGVRKAVSGHFWFQMSQGSSLGDDYRQLTSVGCAIRCGEKPSR